MNSFDIFNQNEPKLTIRPESTSILMPLNNDNSNNRFEQNRLLNGKTKYEETNTIIKSLEEEIVNMKHKLSFVYEKDEEIAKLKKTILDLKKENSELKSISDEVIRLRLDNNKLSEELKNKSKLSTKNIEIEEIEEIESDKEEIEEYIDVNIPKLRIILMNRLKNKQKAHIEGLIKMYGLNKKNRVVKSEMKELLEQAIHI